MEQTDKLNLKITGPPSEGGAVYFAEFREFCDGLESCLRRVERVVTSRRGRVKYRIVGLEAASAAVSLEPVWAGRGRDRSPQVVRLFKRTVIAIQRGKKVDSRFAPDDLEAFKKLASPLNKGAQRVEINGTEITPEFPKNVDRLVKALIQSNGSVRGRLEKLNVHNTFEFVLYPPIDGPAIRCTFPESMVDQVREGIKRSVTVTGKLYFRRDRAFPDKVEVEGMTIHPYDNNLPSLIDLRGLAPGCLGDLTANEFVHGLRNE
jgi:hypothetical protein